MKINVTSKEKELKYGFEAGNIIELDQGDVLFFTEIKILNPSGYTSYYNFIILSEYDYGGYFNTTNGPYNEVMKDFKTFIESNNIRFKVYDKITEVTVNKEL